jgi:hypothetical protein
MSTATMDILTAMSATSGVHAETRTSEAQHHPAAAREAVVSNLDENEMESESRWRDCGVNGDAI